MESAGLGCSVPPSCHRFGDQACAQCSLRRGLFPGSSLIQDTFSGTLRVLKYKPHGPCGAERCTWPLFSCCARGGIRTWLGGTGTSQHLSRHPVTSSFPPRAFLIPCASVSLLRAPSRLADSDVSAAHRHWGGCMGGSGGGVRVRGCFLPMSLQKRSSFISLRMHCGGSLCPSWQQGGSRGSFILRIHQGLACPVSTLNLLEVAKDGVWEEGVIQAAVLPWHSRDTLGCSVLGHLVGTG